MRNPFGKFFEILKRAPSFITRKPVELPQQPIVQPPVKPQLTIVKPAEDLTAVLRRLSYDDPDLRAAIALFQKHRGLEQTGNIGPKTTALLRAANSALDGSSVGQLRKWRLTHYFVATETSYRQVNFVPVYDRERKKIAQVPATFFCSMSLQGTGKMNDGRLMNVAGKPYVPTVGDEYAACKLVYDEHCEKMRQRGKQPRPSRYFGIDVKNGHVVAVQPFQQVPPEKFGVGFGIGKRGVPYTPYRTIATDVGAYGTSDPRFRGNGGLVPAGTRVFIMEFVGRKLPDGSTHDGWFVANDTGGGIWGAHFDVFIGAQGIERDYPIPRSNGVSHVWFDGIEQRVASTYTYGLYDK